MTLYDIVRKRPLDKSDKVVWDKIGILIMDGDKISIRLNAIPVGDWDGWLRVYPRTEEDKPKATHQTKSGGPFVDLDEDLPY